MVAPVDGKVTSIGIGYLESMTSSRGGSVDFDKDFDEATKEFAEAGGPRYKQKYVSHSISLRTDDGRTLHIGGIKLARPFKTGETVSRGEKLGTVRYSYEAIEEPSIKISVSTPRGTVSDPMSPFGIESSFIPLLVLSHEAGFAGSPNKGAGTSHRLIVTSVYDQVLAFIFRSWIPSGRITLPSTRSVATKPTWPLVL